MIYIDSPTFSDTRAKIASIEDAIKNVGCNQIAALVIYNLPGRDCAAKASNGELGVGQINVYKTQYIDRKSPWTINPTPLLIVFSHRCYPQEVPQGRHVPDHRA